MPRTLRCSLHTHAESKATMEKPDRIYDGILSRKTIRCEYALARSHRKCRKGGHILIIVTRQDLLLFFFFFVTSHISFPESGEYDVRFASFLGLNLFFLSPPFSTNHHLSFSLVFFSQPGRIRATSAEALPFSDYAIRTPYRKGEEEKTRTLCAHASLAEPQSRRKTAAGQIVNTYTYVHTRTHTYTLLLRASACVCCQATSETRAGLAYVYWK